MHYDTCVKLSEETCIQLVSLCISLQGCCITYYLSSTLQKTTAIGSVWTHSYDSDNRKKSDMKAWPLVFTF